MPTPDSVTCPADTAGTPVQRSGGTKIPDRIDRYLRAQLVLSDGMSRADREHRMILDACRNNQAEEAAKLTAEHILGAKETLEAHILKPERNT